MDPLSALSLAGTVLQFIQFTFGLLNNSKKIYSSASGNSDDCQHLEEVYTKLLRFSDQLQSQLVSTTGRANALGHASDLEETAATCKQDCRNLLDTVKKLQVESGKKPKWWQSFVKAMHEMWAADDIKCLKARIDSNRISMILSFCAISSENVDRSCDELRQLRSEAKSGHDAREEQSRSLIDSLRELRREIDLIKSMVNKKDGRGISRCLEDDEMQLLTAKVAELSMSKKKFAKEEAVLSALDFEQRPIRHERIPEAHQRTFRWIFGDQSAAQSVADRRFRDWLEEGNGFFWISGKPGSGKSTLMKFVAGAPNTQSSLLKWARSKRVVLGSHFFWSIGSPIQRSQEGLLRTLLHAILLQVPELIPLACKQRWQMDDITQIKNQRWQISELESSFRYLTSVDELPSKFCFFIDGLDEFEGDFLNLSAALQDMCLCTDIKLCVSSRPWNVFEDSFGQDPARKLYVHELTRYDIQRYTESRLCEHPRWSSISAQNSSVATLVTEITNRAMGVFLWVFLVTKMLREGLTNDDSITDLWKRLESLPIDLEMFFKHILSSVEPFYHVKMAGTLLIALAAGPLPIEVYTYHDLEYADENYALKRPVQAMDEHEAEAFHRLTGRRLNGWCKGLVETQNNQVEFIHRTVKDFLQSGDMVNFLEVRAARAFDPRLSILRAYLAWTKNTYVNRSSTTWDIFSSRLNGVLKWAAVSESSGIQYRESYEKLLNDLEASMMDMIPLGFPKLRSSSHVPSIPEATELWFREQLITYDLGEYLSMKLSLDTEYLAEFEQAPLSIVLGQYAGYVISQCEGGTEDFSNYRGCCRVLSCLMAHGENLNEPIAYYDCTENTVTPWKEFIDNFFRLFSDAQDTFETYAEDRQSSITKILVDRELKFLLLHGADPNASVPCHPVDSFFNSSCNVCPFWISWLFLVFYMPKLWRVSELYLQALKIILESGADVKLTLSRCTRDLEDKTLSCLTPWEILSLQLKRLANDDDIEHAYRTERKQLLAQVMVEFAKFAKEASLPWEEIEPDLQRLFSHSQLRQILQALGRSTKDQSVKLRRGAKRPASGSYDLASMKKSRAT